MIRIIRAEIKKILSRPATYVLALFLAIILVLGNIVYHPAQVLSEDTTIISADASVTEKYSFFYNEDYKSDLDTKLSSTINMVLLYKDSEKQKQDIYDKLTAIDQSYENYKASIYNNYTTENFSDDAIVSSREKLVNDIMALNASIELAKSQYYNGAYILITTNKNSDRIYEVYTELLDWANTILVHKSEVGEYFETFQDNLRPSIQSCIDQFKFSTLDKETISKYTDSTAGSKLHILNNRLNVILDDIDNIKNNKVGSLTAKEKSELMDQKINAYKNQILTYTNLVKYDLLSRAFELTSTSEQLDLLYLSENYSQYNVNTQKVRYTYIFENEKTEADYALPLTIGIMSNATTNAYDYAYFILRFFSFVIVAFAVTIASRSISGEAQEGTLRFLALKPVNRREIYFGKILAILLLSIILIIFSAIIALAVGGALYGFDSKTILTIFNGTTPIEMHPITMIVLYLISYLIELTIYLSLATLLSCVLKMDVLPLVIVLVLYAVNTLLPVFVGNINTWLSYYVFSHISLYALFGSPVFAPTGNDLFSKILGVKIYTGSNVILTVAICALLIFIINIVGSILFKKKEL